MKVDRKVGVAAGAVTVAAAAAAAGKAALERRDGGDSGPSRAYRVKQGEDPSEEVRRIAAGRADNALDELGGESDEDGAEAVHEARKNLKKLRSLLRLVRDELGDELYRHENERLRDAGRELSRSRDAEVKLKTATALRERFGGQSEPPGVDEWAEALEAERDELEAESGGSSERAIAGVEVTRARIELWPVGGLDWESFEPGLKRAYKRGRNRFAEVQDDPSDDNVHEWRKRVKDLWYQLRILCEAWPGVIGGTADEAHELANALGDHHDLAILGDDLDGRGELLPKRSREEVRGWIANR